MKWKEEPAKVRPMLATLATPALTGKGLVYEPKYDGIRALVHVAPGREPGGVRIWSRLGNDKTSQFPVLVQALDLLRRRLKGPLLLDGEIVALDADGRPAGFQNLQGRIHLKGPRDVEVIERSRPVALVLFDILRDGDEDVRGLPLTGRRGRLEARVKPDKAGTIRLSEQAFDDGRALNDRAKAEQWEGLIVKEVRAPYQSGRRSPAWRKLKLVNQQEFVVGGWTEPRQSRQYFGALLLGVPEGASGLRYVGHTGTGFDQAELARVSKLLRAREIDRSPFTAPIKSNEPAHWARPDLVAQVRFTEWTADQKLRHPVYLGLRDDKRPRDVVREVAAAEVPAGQRSAASRHPSTRAQGALAQGRAESGKRNPVVEQLRALEDARRDGSIELPDGSRLGVTNLFKVFWPRLKLTKGDLLRYYAEVSPYILPAVADRPLVMKRFPNGIEAKAFYQHLSRREQPPSGVRLERVTPTLRDPQGRPEPSRGATPDPDSEVDSKMFVGGSLITLLYMTQLAAISQDPWFSRVTSPPDADFVALDLDPVEGTAFDRVLEVARWIRDELASLKVAAVAKTSGSRGLHIYIPLPPDTSYESGMLFCQIIATVIASRHPKAATVERAVRARPRGTVYIDYLQNILGKTLATAYSARASEFAGVSTPLRWEELDHPFDPRDYTIVTAPERFREVGDLWARLRSVKPANLEAVFRKYA